MREKLYRLARLPFEVLLVPLILLDELARPFYRPFLRWVASWRIVHRAECWIAARNRLFILVILAIPFAIAEPLKAVGVVVIARGHFRTGALIMVFAYLMSFVVVERIYHAGRAKLLTYPWFAWAIGLMVQVRDYMLERVRRTAIWRLALRLRREAALAGARFRAWIKG